MSCGEGNMICHIHAMCASYVIRIMCQPPAYGFILVSAMSGVLAMLIEC